MNDITELVQLPDPAMQPMVHPLDLPEARRPFRIAWLIASLTSLPIGLLVAALVWFASQNYVVPLIAAATTIGFGAIVGRHFEDQAWAFIPRKRQDRQRPLPAIWNLGSALVFAILLAVVLVLAVLRLDRMDVSIEVREFTFGMGVAAGLLVVGDFFGKILRRRGAARRQALFTLPGVAAVIGGVVVAYEVLLGSSGTDSWDIVLMGSAMMLLVQAGIVIWQHADGRRRSPA
jgi:hypothetical protein